MEYRNQVAAVTGGARGLGRATAQLLAQRGAAGVRELCCARRGRRGGGRGDCDRGRTGYRGGGRRRRLIAAALACGTSAMAGDIAPGGTLRAAYLGTNSAQAMRDPATGEVRGPAYDLARELARRNNVPHGSR